MIQKKIAHKLTASVVIWLLTLGVAFSAQTSAIWENPPEKEILDSGLALIYHKDISSAITILQIIIKGGKRAEPEGKDGLGYLTTRLAIEIPDRGKIQNLMSLASRISVASEGDYSLIQIASLSENLEKTLKITTEIMTKPLFSGLRIDGIKKHMLHHRNIQEDNPVRVGHHIYLKELFRETAYGNSVLGSEESIKAIKKKDIKDFYDNYFKAGNMIVAVSSDLEKDKINEIIKKFFTKLPKGKPAETELNALSALEEKNLFIEKDTEQTFVSAGFLLPKLTSKYFALAYMVEILLGKGVGSRLWTLRSKEKLAYNVNCIATQMKEGGFLNAYLETDTEQTDIALEALKKVLNDLYGNGITEDELEITKINSRASFLRENETKENRTKTMASFEALGLGCEFLNSFFEEINTMSLMEINDYIRDIFNPEKRLEVIVGPKKNL